jgi:uncharacterized phage protein (TIGR02218 family)
MSFNTFETSVETGEPVEFYSIIVGTSNYYYTSGEDARTIGGNVYNPIAISRGKIDLSREQRTNIVDVLLPSDNPFALSYVATIPGQEAKLTIYRLHRDDTPSPEVLVMFEGSVQSVSFEQNSKVARLAVIPASDAASRTIPRFTFQSACNHVLGDARCKIDENLFKFTGTVSAVSGNVITIPGANAFGPGYFTAGRVDLSSITDSRLVLAHTGDLLTLLLPFGVNVLGQPVTAFAGCAHDPTTCFSKFNNTINYGGFDFVPLKDIFRNGIL